ncbi:DUF3365 domain-containing protein [Methylophaga sp.]|jgi:hypothetical protein|uniref:Tll0287-like domain-containing protein n=1 Tax=Methylophaga sp. TaxID=2024840 RepID=UPI0013FFA022|nr:DUF3365 domain-containing protein [Methylophaga sp.]MTI63278.1 DUF3365 domain-containing protein [Methylophaga sp.]
MRSFALMLALLLTGMVGAQADTSKQAFEDDAKAAIKELATSLKSSLLAAMNDGGPAEAVSVCNLIAPSLAAEISKKYGLEIDRTSLKVRNPANEADAWETDVLQRFETRLAGGEAIQKLTFSEKVETGPTPQWRMMKAIPTDKVCLSCHGSKIAEPVQARIDTHYPDDMATGFKLGEIRGAFSVKREIIE